MKFTLKRTVSMLTMMVILMSSSASIRVDATAITVTYSKYDCVNGGAPSTYSLSISESDLSRIIIGEDDRVNAGFDGVVRLSSGASGFIVDDHVIATAAHCVNETHEPDSIKNNYQDTHYFRPDMKIHLYNSDGTPKNATPLDIVEIHVPQDYILNNTYDEYVKHDYALLVVEEDLSDYTHFDLGIPYNVRTASFRNIPLFATGRSQSYNGVANTQNLLYTSQGYRDTRSNSEMLYYTCDTVGGNSGCPIYVACEYTVGSDTYITYTAVAIHFGGDNKGPIMTSSKIQFYLNNPYIDY